MTNLLDERIDHHQNMDAIGTKWCVLYFTGPQYQGIAIPSSNYSPERLRCNRSIAADSVGRATLQKTCQEENEENDEYC